MTLLEQKRIGIEAELDYLIRSARDGDDVSSTRAMVLSSVDLLVEIAHGVASARSGRVIEEYKEMARKRREGGHA